MALSLRKHWFLFVVLPLVVSACVSERPKQKKQSDANKTEKFVHEATKNLSQAACKLVETSSELGLCINPGKA